MQISRKFEFPDHLKDENEKAKKLTKISIIYIVSVIFLMYFVVGSSQAMRTAWIEYIISLIPPVVHLISEKFVLKSPTNQHQYGFHSASTISFLAGSVALLLVGIFLFYEGVTFLLKQEHPTIGAFTFAGKTIWLGWLMLAVLLYSAIPSAILGAKKIPLAKKLHDKVLYADAYMNKADWLSSCAAFVGIIGIGFGIWWADSVAAIAISIEILIDGFKNVKTSIKDLMDRIPLEVERTKIDKTIFKVKEYLSDLDWIEKVEIRMREDGHSFFGEAFVVPQKEVTDLTLKISEAQKQIHNLDWKIFEVIIMPVVEIPDELIKNVFIDKDHKI